MIMELKEEKIKEIIAKKIKEIGAVVTHFGDDLDNKSAIYAVQKWGEENGFILKGQELQILRVSAGQVKNGYLNLDTGGHKGSFINDDGETIVVDGDPKNGIKSASEAVSKLGIYVPKQIVEIADTKPNRVSSLDSRSGLALVRYLSGNQTFKLAEEGLLDKQLSDEQIKEFGLEDAHKKQQDIIDTACEKIKKYTEETTSGEKIVLAPEQILAGSGIAYELGINYYVSASTHLDKEKIPDGVTFAITCKPGVKLPENVLAYGRELVEKYRIDENSSGVFVNPNGQMIVAGGFKNPNFKIEGKSVEEMLEEILKIFDGNEIDKNKQK